MPLDADRPFKKTDPPAPPEQMKSKTNPSSKFEGRRKFWIVALVAGFLLVCGIAARGLMNPFGNMGIVAVSASATPTKFAVTVGTPTPMVVRIPSPAASVTPTRRSAAGNVGTSVMCWAVADAKLGDGSIVPNGAMIRATGYSAAYGGLLETSGGWLPIAKFNCERELSDLEKPYVVTPVKKSSAPVSASVDPEGWTVVAGAPLTNAYPPRLTPAIVNAPTATPISPTPTPLNGIWRDGDCWQVNVQGVREIWINGHGVSIGRFCNVNDIRLIVGMAAVNLPTAISPPTIALPTTIQRKP
jgi:hypothetical protein